MDYSRHCRHSGKFPFSLTLAFILLILALSSPGFDSVQAAYAWQGPAATPSEMTIAIPTPEPTEAPVAMGFASDLVFPSSVNAQAGTMAQPINADIEVSRGIIWVPVQITPQDTITGTTREQSDPLIAEDSDTEMPIPGHIGASGEGNEPLALPNLKYYNAPNGSFYVTPWSDIHWGDSITVYWGIQNNGAENISSGTRFDWRFYLSTNDYISTSDYPWYTLYRTIGLSAGYYTSGDFTRALPDSPPSGFPSSGTIYIGMYVDYDDKIIESDETDNGNQGQFNDYDYVIIASCSYPGTPSLTSPEDGAYVEGTGVLLDWGSVSGAVSYHVQVDNDPLFSSVDYEGYPTSSNWQIPASLSPGTAWYWRVRAHNDCGDGNWSAIWSFAISVSEIVSVNLHPSPPAGGTVNENFHLDLDVEVQTSWNSALQVEVRDGTTLILRTRKCKGVVGSSVEDFSLYFTESSPGGVDYSIAARLRPGGSCYIEDSREGDVFESYHVDWSDTPDLQAIATANPADTNPNGTVQLIGTQSTGDPDSYEWAWVSGPQKVIPQYNQEPTARVTLRVPGIYFYKLSVRKGDIRDSATVQINVGQLPTANAGTDQTSLSIGSLVQLDGSGSDPLGRQLHYEWSQTGGFGVQLSDPTDPVPSFLLPEPGTYEFKMVIWVDQNGERVESAPDFVRVSTGSSGTVAGVVFQDTNKDGDYTPGVDATVEAATVQAGGESTQSEPDGGYSLSLPAGTYDLSATKPGEGTGYAFGVIVPAGDSVTANIPLGAQNCQSAAGIPVCADDLSETSPGSGIWTGGSNIHIGSHLVVDGSVEANTNSGQERVSGNGQVRFDLRDGTSLAVYTGDYEIDVNTALVNMVGAYTRELAEILGFRLSGMAPGTEPQIVLNANGSLTVTNAKIEVQKPSQITLDLIEFAINDQGVFSGSVQEFTTQIGDMDLVVSNAQFNNSGLLLDGTLTLPDSLSGSSSTLSIDGLALTRDGIQFDSIELADYSLDIGGMMATIESAIITNEGIQASGEVTIPSDITPSPIKFDEITITRDGIQGGRVHLETLQDLEIGPAYFTMHNATLEMVNDGSGLRSMIAIEYADLRLVPALDDSQTVIRVDDLLISDQGVSFRRGEATLQTMTVGQFTIKEASVLIEQRTGGGYAFAGKGTLVIQQLAPGSSNTAITAGVQVYITEETLIFERAQLGIRGPRIPLGNTGAFLTGLYGEVDFAGEAVEFSVTVDLEAGPRVGELVAISGQVGTTINLNGWMRLEGNMKLFSYEVTQVSLSINQPGVSENGVRGSLHLDVFAIFIGDATVYVYVDSNGDPAMEGSADVLVQVPFGKLPDWAQVLVGGDLENVPLGEATATLGEFDGVYGISATAAYLNPLNPEVPLFELTVFVNAEGKIKLGVDWPNPFSEAAAHVTQAERHVPLPTRYQSLFDANTDQDTSVVTLDGNARWVAFYLDATGYPYLTFSLIDPGGNVISEANVDQYPDVTLERLDDRWTYLVDYPSVGDWYMVVDGTTGGEVYHSEAFVKDTAPSVTLTGVSDMGEAPSNAPLANSYEIAWTAEDPENSATISLHYDIDGEGFDGVLIADDLALNDSPYVWTPGELPTGNYYIYGKVEDNLNPPRYSYFDTPISVVNTTTPITPTGISARVGISTTVLSWSPNSEVDLAGYVVRYAYQPGLLTQVLTTTESSVTVPRPDLTKALTMTVAAFDTSGNKSAPSMPVVVSAGRVDDTFPPAPPEGLIAVLVGTDVSLNWQPAQAEGDLAGYRLYYDNRKGAPYLGVGAQQGDSPLDLGDVTGLTLLGPARGRVLYAMVTAIDTAGNESLPSSEVAIRVTDGVDGDGDGLPDDFELAHWENTAETDGSTDSDLDGLNEAEEYQRFTLPLDADSDGDRAFDSDEVASGTDPLGPDDRPTLSVVTYSLPQSIEGAAYIAQLQAISGTLPYDWELTFGRLPDGLTLSSDGQISGTPTESGRFPITVRVQDANSQFDSQRLTCVVTPTQRPPQITHTPVATATENTPVPITATVTSEASPITVTLHYRVTGTLDFTDTLMSNTSGDTYEATIPPSAVTLAGVDYYISAINEAGETTSGTAATPHHLEVTPTWVSHAIPIQTGWNLVGLPISPTTSYDAESLCAEINDQGGDITEVDRWHAAGWDSHLCGLPFNNFPVELNEGYFVRSEANFTWLLTGTHVAGQVVLSLSPGWNLVSLAEGIDYLAEQLGDDINAQGGSCMEIDRWHVGGWDSHVIDLPFNDFTIEPGRGYFIKCDSASVFTTEIP